MQARVLRGKAAPDKIDEGTAHFKAKAAPKLREQEGYGGNRLMVDRETGNTMVITFWDDERTLQASEEAMRGEREEAFAKMGAELPKSENYEAAIQHRPKPTEEGNWVRVSTLKGDPAKVDEGIRNFESQVVPNAERLPGFRAAVLLVDRASGQALGATVWDNKSDMESSAESMGKIRAQAAQVAGAGEPKVEVFEVAHAELLTPATR
jgi:heme-degrading monooxygenase HmoA